MIPLHTGVEIQRFQANGRSNLETAKQNGIIIYLYIIPSAQQNFRWLRDGSIEGGIPDEFAICSIPNVLWYVALGCRTSASSLMGWDAPFVV